jgi:hypothetical protein
MTIEKRIHRQHPHHPDHPYDPNNPLRTETQRLKSQGINPDEHHRLNFPVDMKLLAAYCLGIGCIVAFAVGFAIGS